MLELELEQKFDTKNDKEYEVEAIPNSKVHTKEAESELPGVYYFVSWKGFIKKKHLRASIVYYTSL